VREGEGGGERERGRERERIYKGKINHTLAYDISVLNSDTF
jgi:hypothetical protein